MTLRKANLMFSSKAFRIAALFAVLSSQTVAAMSPQNLEPSLKKLNIPNASLSQKDSMSWRISKPFVNLSEIFSAPRGEYQWPATAPNLIFIAADTLSIPADFTLDLQGRTLIVMARRVI